MSLAQRTGLPPSSSKQKQNQYLIHMERKPCQTTRIKNGCATRFTPDMQNEISLEAQEDRCRKDIAERGGAVVAVYSDGAKNGWSLDREGFNQLGTPPLNCG